MTTPLNAKIALIDQTYPTAGQDNDSQGFRDNFNNIKDSLSLASSDIVELQSKAVLKAGIGTNDTVTNDLAGSSITNGQFNTFYATAYSPVAPVTTGQYVDLANGSFQSFVMGADIDFTFRGWPTTGQYAVVRLLLTAQDPTIPRTATFNSYQSQNIYYGNSGILNQLVTNNSFKVPATYVRPATLAATAAATKIKLTDVSNLRAGNAVSYTNNGTGPSPVTTTISAVNADTGEITLTDAVVTGGILLNDPITIRYTGARVIEAFTFDGGSSVYISLVSDF
jgi:hypothetical protein